MRDQSGTMVVRQYSVLCYEDVLGHLNVKRCPSPASPLHLCPHCFLLPWNEQLLLPNVKLIHILFALEVPSKTQSLSATGIDKHGNADTLGESCTYYLCVCACWCESSVWGKPCKQSWQWCSYRVITLQKSFTAMNVRLLGSPLAPLFLFNES